MYERMVQIRLFEDLAGKHFADGLVPGFVHLYAGEEAVAVGSADLTDRDYISQHPPRPRSLHRQGCRFDGMVAELMGKATGTCKGKGGSMHIADSTRHARRERHCRRGIAACRRRRADRQALGTGGVAVSFFGDGASNQGAFHEALNLAAIWNLPAVFVCENNGYAESTPVHYHCSTVDIAEPRRVDMRCPGSSSTDSTSSPSTRRPARIARARRGEGPSLIEAKTYRYYGHFQGDMITYRTEEELNRYKGSGRYPVSAQLHSPARHGDS